MQVYFYLVDLEIFPLVHLFFLISSLKEEREANVATLNFLLPKVVQFQTLLTEKCLQFMPWSHPLAQITHRHAPDFSRNTKEIFKIIGVFTFFPGIKNWQRCFQVNCIFSIFSRMLQPILRLFASMSGEKSSMWWVLDSTSMFW